MLDIPIPVLCLSIGIVLFIVEFVSTMTGAHINKFMYSVFIALWELHIGDWQWAREIPLGSFWNPDPSNDPGF